MDVIPSAPTPKQTKPKAKAEVAPKKAPVKKAPASAPVKTKKPRIARPLVQSEPEAAISSNAVGTRVEVLSTAGLSSSDLQHEIAIAAYFLAEQRNFSPGHELDDWLSAERQVRETRAI
jgi:DUF2934 family protein